MVEMLDIYNNLSQKDIENFETSNSIELTDSYKRFLLKWNAGTPDIGVFMISEEEGPTAMNYFYSIGDAPGGNAILLGISGPHYDQIYFWDHENEPDLDEPDMSNMYFLADNIWNFLDNLNEDESDDDEE